MKEIELTNKIAKVEEILRSVFGEPDFKNRKRLSVLDEMILTILSQNTNDKNSLRAFRQLKDRFPTVDRLAQAGRDSIADAIKTGGLGKIKAGYILGLLNWLKNTYGTYDCTFICKMETEEIIDLFSQVKGIGVKTIAVTLAFACERDVFPVDTHIYRVMKRLGLLPGINSPHKAFFFLRNIIPPGKGTTMHMNVIRHGREICSARKPLCENCPLKNICQYYSDIKNPPEKTV